MKSEQNFSMPAEWEQQDCVQLCWPDKQTDWAPLLDKTRKCYAEIIAQIAERQKVLLCCRHVENAKKHLKNLNLQNIVWAELPYNDTWTRDFGAITLKNNAGNLILNNFKFNGWGLKFASFLDNQATPALASKKIFNPAAELVSHHDFVLEGGSIESNGNGILLTTSKCLLSLNRNEHLSRQQVEKELKKRLGMDQVHWLENGFLEGDDTDAHIDTLARFTGENAIAYVSCKDKNDVHFAGLKLMEEEIQGLRNKDGKPFQLYPLPMPEPLYGVEGERLPATYANFLIINDAVLVPVYDQKADDEAVEIFEQMFKSREIIPVDCSILTEQHGSLHCVTMQYPKGALNNNI